MRSLRNGLSLSLLVTSSTASRALSFVHPSIAKPKSRLMYKSTDTTLPPATTAVATEAKPLPKIIQGGMGVRISSWKLAREVSNMGQLGVVSGTAMDTVFVRTLQDGDPGGHFRRALASFPNQAVAQQALDKYFTPEGKAPTKPYRSLPMWTLTPNRALEEATILGSFCEVWLAKHNDDGSPTGGLVGINRLTKVALPTIHSLYGAMLADVDYVIMGAGIPSKIPGILDALSCHHDCSFPIEVSGGASGDEEYAVTFSPKTFWKKGHGTPGIAKKPLKRPAFLPIVSSTTLATSLLKRSNGSGPTRGIDGFVVELNEAGGHNAPPRGWHFEPDDHDEPKYGDKDLVDVEAFGKVAKGLPFWFAGHYGRAEKLAEVLDAGGNGIQVGTLFALADESGMEPTMRKEILSELAEHQELKVFTDPAASPTGFPFKVLQLEDGMKTLSNPEVYNARPRVCNLGYLRAPYLQKDGKVGYRCPSECVADYVAKGGDERETVGRKCLCNALTADAGFAQVRNVHNPVTGERELYSEPSLVTMGDDVNQAAALVKQREDGSYGYTASDVVDYLTASQRQGRKSGQLLTPCRWGYSETAVDEYLLSEWDHFCKQTRGSGVPELMAV